MLEAVLAARRERLDTILLATRARPTQLGSGLVGAVARVREAGLRAYRGRARARGGARRRGGRRRRRDRQGPRGRRLDRRAGRVRALPAAARRARRSPCSCTGGSACTRSPPPTSSGAAGAVLDAQLLLARESPLPERAARGARRRSTAARRRRSAASSARRSAPTAARAWTRPRAAARAPSASSRRAPEPREALACGRQGARRRRRRRTRRCSRSARTPRFAAELAQRFGTVAGIIDGLRAAIAGACETLERGNPLAEGARSRNPTAPAIRSCRGR